MMQGKTHLDWKSIGREYRAGIRSLRDIAKQYGISDTAIRKKAAKEGWERDLTAKIKLKAEELVRNTEVRDSVRSELEADIIESNAQVIAAVLLNERADIQRLSNTCERLEVELESCDDGLEKKARILKALVDTRKTLIELRRRNYSINDSSHGDADVVKKDSFEDWIANGLLGNVIGVSHC